jgi:hypothetical protein
MLAGFAEIEFTPASGNRPGGFTPSYAEGRDENGLFSNVAAFTSGDTSVILVSMDVLSFHDDYANAMRKRISDATGVPERNILIAATHSHSSTTVEYQLWLCPPDKELTDKIADKTVEAAIAAFNDRKEAKLGVGKTYNNKFNFCRDFYITNGDIEMNPGYDRDDIVGPVTIPDHSVDVMRVDDENGSIRAFIVNYANHPCCHERRADYKKRFSADFPGYLRSALKRKFGEDVKVIFFTGAAGDVNCIDYEFGTTKIYNEPETSERRDIGESLANDVEALNPRIFANISDPFIQVKSELHSVPRRKKTALHVEWAKENMERAKTEELSTRRLAFSTEYLEQDDPTIPDTVDLEIHTIQIGPWAIVGLPGEIFTEIAKKIKASSPYARTLIFELANGTNGYISPDYMHDSTVYEAQFSKYNAFTGKGTADILVNESLRMLGELKQKDNEVRFTDPDRSWAKNYIL